MPTGIHKVSDRVSSREYEYSAQVLSGAPPRSQASNTVDSVIAVAPQTRLKNRNNLRGPFQSTISRANSSPLLRTTLFSSNQTSDVLDSRDPTSWPKIHVPCSKRFESTPTLFIVVSDANGGTWQAEKTLAGAGGGFGFFGSREQKYMDAADLFTQAANAFRLQKSSKQEDQNTGTPSLWRD